MIRVQVSYTDHDGTTRSVNVDGTWHRGFGPGSFMREVWAPAFEVFGISPDDPSIKAIRAEVVGEVIDGRLHAKQDDGTCSGCNEVFGNFLDHMAKAKTRG